MSKRRSLGNRSVIILAALFCQPLTAWSAPPCEPELELVHSCCGTETPPHCKGNLTSNAMFGEECSYGQILWTCLSNQPGSDMLHSEPLQPGDSSDIVDTFQTDTTRNEFIQPQTPAVDANAACHLNAPINSLEQGATQGITNTASILQTILQHQLPIGIFPPLTSLQFGPLSPHQPVVPPTTPVFAHLLSPALPQHAHILQALSAPHYESSIMPSCCKVVTLTNTPGKSMLDPQYFISKGSHQRDPYATGTQDFKPTSMADNEQKGYVRDQLYFYTPPHSIGTGFELPKNQTYTIPTPIEPETYTSWSYIQRRLASTLTPAELNHIEKVLTYAGSGLTSDAFFRHPPMPSDEQLASMYPDLSFDGVSAKWWIREHTTLDAIRAGNWVKKGTILNDLRREKWIQEHTIEVIKLRIPHPGQNGNIAKSASYARRDYVLNKVLPPLIKNFYYLDSKYQPHTLVKVANYTQTLAKTLTGIFRQPAVFGPAADEIKELVNLAQTSNSTLAIQYLTAQFGSVNDAERQLEALEGFYHEIHPSLIPYQIVNNLPILSSYVHEKTGRKDKDGEEEHKAIPIASDYRHGGNVIRGEKMKEFYIIDP